MKGEVILPALPLRRLRPHHLLHLDSLCPTAGRCHSWWWQAVADHEKVLSAHNLLPLAGPVLPTDCGVGVTAP